MLLIFPSLIPPSFMVLPRIKLGAGQAELGEVEKEDFISMLVLSLSMEVLKVNSQW